MATGRGLRAKWTVKLAKALGWNRGRVAHVLAHNGINAPYKSELKALQVMAGYGQSLAKYTPTDDAVGVEVVPAVVKPFRGLPNAPREQSATLKKIVGPASPPPDDDKKKHGKWTDRLLLTRLAKLLPEGATASGKNRARYILKRAGITGNVKTLEEAQALEAFKQAGIDITRFEFASKPGEPGGMLVAPAATEYASLLMQYTELGTRLMKTTGEIAERDAAIGKLQDLLDLTRRGLLSYEKMMLGTPSKPGLAATKFGGLPKPLNYPIDVLAEIRE
jgi:hypothetical protein